MNIIKILIIYASVSNLLEQDRQFIKYSLNKQFLFNNKLNCIQCVSQFQLAIRKYHIILSMLHNHYENGHEKYEQSMRNKTNHSKYGNRMKEKPKTNYKLMNLNKGHSDFPTHRNKIQHLLHDEKVDILVLTEANIKLNAPEQLSPYSNLYNIEFQCMTGVDKGRVVILICKGIKYERRIDLEAPNVSLCTVFIKTGRRTGFAVIGIYREWQQPQGVTGLTTRSTFDQCEHLKIIMEKVDEISTKSNEVIQMGDINIDLYEPNDPMSHFENAALNCIYQEHNDCNYLHQMNFEPTHHWPG